MNNGIGKVTVVGAGSIGSMVAYVLMMRQVGKEVVLVNRSAEKAETKAFDMSHCSPMLGNTRMLGGSIEKSAGSQVIIITVGTLPRKDGSRMDVLERNLDIYRELIPYLAKLSPEAVFLTVTNPVDIMALAVAKYSGFPRQRILGTGTLLDTLRFRSFIAETLNISSEQVQALIVGEHGESMVPIWNQVKIGSCYLERYVKEKGIIWNQEIRDSIEDKTRRAGWKIREGNEHSSYAIAFSAVLITEAILREKRDYLPVSFYQKDKYGSDDIFLSLPVRLSKTGFCDIEQLDLSNEERVMLERSAVIIKNHVSEIKF